MRPTVIKKRIDWLIDYMDTGLDEILEMNNPDALAEFEKAVLALNEYNEAMKIVMRTKEQAAVEKRRINRKSMKVFKAFDYQCAVCRLQDPSCQQLSRVRLLAEPTIDDHYICLCKEHKEEFSKLLPWQQRVDAGESIDVLNVMIEEYLQSVQHGTQST